MDAEMANFMGIHMLNDNEDIKAQANMELGLSSSSSNRTSKSEQYFCPDTGAHFEFFDLNKRMRSLQKRRAIIDKAIEDEDRAHKRKNKSALS
jgi:hypothetical protein